MDAEISKAMQKILTKQGMKFKLNTKVTKGDDSGSTIKVDVEAAKGGKNESVRVYNPKFPLNLTLTVYSLMPMWYSSPLGGVRTRLALDLRMSASRRTIEDD